MKLLKFKNKPTPEDVLKIAPELAGKEVKLGLLDDGSYVLLVPEN